MEYIHKLPFMLGAFMAIVIGVISYKSHISQQDTYIRIAICMIAFYTLGIYIRNTINRIIDEVEKKKEDQERKEQEERIKQEEIKKQIDNANSNTSKFDFKIDERYDEGNSPGEDFSPLTVKEMLRSGSDK